MNSMNKDKETPLHLCFEDEANFSEIKLLTENGAKMITENSRGEGPVHIAIRKQVLDTVEFILERGFAVHHITREGYSPLHYALKYFNQVNCDPNKDGLSILKALLNHEVNGRVNVNAKDCEGETALHIAATRGLMDAAELLLSYGAEVNNKDNNQDTPLCKAICNKHLEMVKLLLKNHASLTDKHHNGLTVYDIASQNDEHIYQLLLLLQ